MAPTSTTGAHREGAPPVTGPSMSRDATGAAVRAAKFSEVAVVRRRGGQYDVYSGGRDYESPRHVRRPPHDDVV
jgi:hypothetical protein